MTLGRNESFQIQVFQIADAFLVWLAFWFAGQLSDPIRQLLGASKIEEHLISSMNWLLYIAVPFTPLVLEHFNFYNRLRQKTRIAGGWPHTWHVCVFCQTARSTPFNCRTWSNFHLHPNLLPRFIDGKTAKAANA